MSLFILYYTLALLKSILPFLPICKKFSFGSGVFSPPWAESFANKSMGFMIYNFKSSSVELKGAFLYTKEMKYWKKGL